jgi:hypothetical protein
VDAGDEEELIGDGMETIKCLQSIPLGHAEKQEQAGIFQTDKYEGRLVWINVRDPNNPIKSHAEAHRQSELWLKSSETDTYEPWQAKALEDIMKQSPEYKTAHKKIIAAQLSKDWAGICAAMQSNLPTSKHQMYVEVMHEDGTSEKGIMVRADATITVKENIRVGTWLSFDMNGRLRKYQDYEFGIPHGDVRTYTADGKLDTRGSTTHGVITGKHFKYKDGRAVVMSEFTKKGEKMGERPLSGKAEEETLVGEINWDAVHYRT